LSDNANDLIVISAAAVTALAAGQLHKIMNQKF
jgi:hypothetical protein